MSLGERGRGPGQFNLISSVAVGPQDEIIVADARLQVRAVFLLRQRQRLKMMGVAGLHPILTSYEL